MKRSGMTFAEEIAAEGYDVATSGYGPQILETLKQK